MKESAGIFLTVRGISPEVKDCFKKTLLQRGETAGKVVTRMITEYVDGDAVWVLGQIIDALPENRDWLDPQTESIARIITGKEVKR